MTLKQLEYAVAIDEAGSVCAAASALRVAQPSLSQQLLALERELGVSLFSRTPQGTVPTRAGRAFLAEARTTLAAAQRARGAVTRETTVVLVQGAKLAQRVRDALGDDALVVVADDDDDLVRRAAQEDVDLAVGSAPTGEFAGDTLELACEPCALVLAADDALLDDDSPVVSLADLAGRRRLTLPGDPPLAGGVAALPADTPATALRLAAAGVGWALVPTDAITAEVTHLVRPLDPPVVRRTAAFAATSFSPAQRALAEQIAAALAAG
jgi:DNA-binding transcriptional LysR family regulator